MAFYGGDERCDTIVAPATPVASGLRAVVRVAGRRALEIAAGVFTPLPLDCGGARVLEGWLQLEPVRLPAAAWVFRAPRSYTGDDVVELHLVSSPALIDRLLERLCAGGARLARPGEFSRRAFLAGRLDLLQVEAIGALCTSADRGQARAAAAWLRGALRERVEQLREQLLALLAELEAALDFADQDLDRELLAQAEVAERLRAVERGIGSLLGREVRRERGGARPRVVLHGRPNAGKSSLFNALCGARGAIVSPQAGTTRDPVRGVIEVASGLEVELFDPAGVDEAEACDAIDAEARARAVALAASADLVLHVIDGRRGGRSAASLPPGSEVLEVWTKSDLARPQPGADGVIVVSSRTGEGLGALRRAIAARLGAAGAREAEAVLDPNTRHRVALERARQRVQAAGRCLAEGAAEELAAIDLRAALDALGEVTGESATDDVLDRIFAQFCIGK